MSDSTLAEVIEYLTERRAAFPRDSVAALLAGALEVFAPDAQVPSYCDRGPCVMLLGHQGRCTTGDCDTNSLPADECTNHASNFLLPDGRYQCLVCGLQFVGCEPCDTSGRWTLMYGEGDNGECPACDGTGAAEVEKAAVCTCGEPLDEHPDGPPCPPPPPPGTPFA